MPSDYGRSPAPVRTSSGGIGTTRPVIQAPRPPQMDTNLTQMPAQMGPQVSAPSPAVAAPAMPAMTNTATPSPQLTAAQGQYDTRLSQLQAPKGTDPNQQFLIDAVKTRMGTDNTNALIDREQFRIADAAAARKAGMTNESGRAGAGAGNRDLNRIDSAAARASAAAADNIRLGREGQMDALTLGSAGIFNAPANMELAREGNLNAFTTAGLPYAQAANQNAQAQQSLGLQQWGQQANYGLAAAGLQQSGNIAAGNQALQQQQMAQQAQIAQQQMQQGYWSQLLRASGY